jgi:YgiT-type zinc finger domain-containing protein
MKCVICKHGQTQAGRTTVTLERGESVITYKNVPAQVCDNCGEAYVDSQVSTDLLSAAAESVRQGVEFDVRRYALA